MGSWRWPSTGVMPWRPALCCRLLLWDLPPSHECLPKTPTLANPARCLHCNPLPLKLYATWPLAHQASRPTPTTCVLCNRARQGRMLKRTPLGCPACSWRSSGFAFCARCTKATGAPKGSMPRCKRRWPTKVCSKSQGSGLRGALSWSRATMHSWASSTAMWAWCCPIWKASPRCGFSMARPCARSA